MKYMKEIAAGCWRKIRQNKNGGRIMFSDRTEIDTLADEEFEDVYKRQG